MKSRDHLYSDLFFFLSTTLLKTVETHYEKVKHKTMYNVSYDVFNSTGKTNNHSNNTAILLYLAA